MRNEPSRLAKTTKEREQRDTHSLKMQSQHIRIKSIVQPRTASNHIPSAARIELQLMREATRASDHSSSHPLSLQLSLAVVVPLT